MIGLKKEDVLEIELDLTGTCNLACPLCTRSYENAQHLIHKNIRPLIDIITQLDQFPNLRNVCLAGVISEPTMYKELPGLITYLVNRNIQIELYTNANTHKPDWWEELGKLFSTQDRVYFTICGSTQELHEKYRVGSNLQQILDHAAAFRKNGKCIDYIQHIRFEYNAADLESQAMKDIISQFSNPWLIDSLPYQERFNIIKTDTDIKMIEPLAAKYKTIKIHAISRHVNNTPCNMKCKSLETKFLSIDNYGNIAPCFLYRIYKKEPFDHTDYSEILQFKNEFCYECEGLTSTLLKRNGLENMG